SEIPRVNGKLLSQYLGRMVYVICDANSVGQDNFGNQVLRTTDGVNITAKLPSGETLDSQYVQFMAKVTEPTCVEVQSICNAGANKTPHIY
ncbi:hypothetical protein B484DRAFT_412202, partial [Ochromonadaceae sp. CCMP2298]